MKAIIASLLLSSLLLYSCRNNSGEANTTTVPNTIRDSFYLVEGGDGFSTGLNAIVDGKTISIIDTSKHLYIRIDTILDYDQDNDLDALMLYSESGGGNCCPDAYFLVTNMGGSKFIRSGMTEPSFQAPEFEQWKGQHTLVVRVNDAGNAGDDYKETIYRYAIEKGKIRKTESLETPEMSAIGEIKVTEFESTEEVHDLLFDLDNDNVADTIRCSIWERWNLLVPDFIFSDGSVYDDNGMSAKRIGILSSKTNGHNDLVLDLNRVFKWDGKAYKNEKEE